ncbi:MAG: type II toxin-antitoxin system RelE/ParE family toxin [Bacteroidota bacterium]
MSNKIRTVIAYKKYFVEFLQSQPEKVQDKIYKIIEIIETQQQIPEKFLKQIKGVKGLYETRFRLASNIWRVFCFFDERKLVILLNGFQKKTEKTPKREIAKASRLMQEYYSEKKQTR